MDNLRNTHPLGKNSIIKINSQDFFSIAAALLWGINYVMVKSVLFEIPENIFLMLRFSLAVGLLLLFVIVSGESLKVPKPDLPRIFLLGCLGVGGYNILWTAGIHLTTASNAALIVSTSPLFAQLYMQMVRKEKIRPKQWNFTMAAFLGIFLMIGKPSEPGFDFSSQYFLGNIIVFLSALLFASYTVFAQPLLEKHSPVKLNALAMAAGLPLLIVYGFVSGPVFMGAVSGVTILKMLYIIIFGTVVAYIFWYEGIKKTGPVKVILFHYLVPVSSTILGVLFLGETISLLQILGAVLALGSIIAAQSG